MNTAAKQKLSTRDLTRIAVFAALMAVCSWITIPATVPFTLQTLGVFLAVGLLGGRRGTLAIVVYVLLGAIGMPVFAGFSSGLGGTSSGYIVGFVFSALLMWAMEKALGRSVPVLAVSMGCCYADDGSGLVRDPLYHSRPAQDRLRTAAHRAPAQICGIKKKCCPCALTTGFAWPILWARATAAVLKSTWRRCCRRCSPKPLCALQPG